MNVVKRLRYQAARRFAKCAVKATLDRPIISFSFDDFPKSAAEEGADILGAHDIRASYYACADFAGRKVDDMTFFDPDDIAKLAAAGHEIGCHTASHAEVSRLDAQALNAEIDRNAAYFASIGHDAPLTTFAYPFGDVSASTKKFAKDRFAVCRGAWPGVNEGEIDLALLKCVCLEAHILEKRSVEQWIEEALRLSGWLIFLTHDVQRDPTYFGVTPTFLANVAKRLKASGAEILPIAEALDRVVDGT